MDFKDFKLLIWLIILKLFKDFWNGDNKKVLVEILVLFLYFKRWVICNSCEIILVIGYKLLKRMFCIWIKLRKS